MRDICNFVRLRRRGYKSIDLSWVRTIYIAINDVFSFHFVHFPQNLPTIATPSIIPFAFTIFVIGCFSVQFDEFDAKSWQNSF